MQPTRATELSLQFAAGISPWWLLVLLPVAAAAGWWIYRGQFKGVDRASRVVLLAMRLGLLAALVFLAFRPSLILRNVLTYPGRVLVVLDDSESMGAPDTGMTDAEALRLRRRLEGHSGAPGETFYDLARAVETASAHLRRFAREAADMDRATDAFWEVAERAQDRVTAAFDRLVERAQELPPLADEQRRELADVLRGVDELRGTAAGFFAGDSHPDARAFARYHAAAAVLAERLHALQAGVDSAALEAGAVTDGDEALPAEASALRARARLDLVAEKLRRMGPALSDSAPDQGWFTVGLMSGRRAELAALDWPHETVPGETDIIGRLDELLAEPSDFPLGAVVFVSDGRDVVGGPLEDLLIELARKQVPVYGALVGGERAPVDVAVQEVIAPPIAAQGLPVDVKVRLRTILPGPRKAKVTVTTGESELAAQEFSLGAGEEQTVRMRVTPRTEGLGRYGVTIQSLPGEAFPVRNNSAEFAMHVRKERVKVLLLDWKPRWETRFALNILQRLPYVDLNPIVVVVQPDGELRRGVQRGTWPESPESLAIYDLVVLGDLPDGLLTEAEVTALRDFVTEGGKTLCFLGTTARDVVPAGLSDLLPAGARPAEWPVTVPGELAGLTVGPAGRLHPITKSFKSLEDAGPASDASGALLLGAGPLVTPGLAGKGKVVLVETDRLWKLLNPTALAAHTDMYVGLVTYAVQGGYSPKAPKPGQAALALDHRALTTRDGLQVWLGGATGAIEAVAGEVVVGEAEAQGTPLARAVFEGLPARDVRFRLKAAPDIMTDPVVVVSDYRELKDVSRDAAFVRRLARGSGGAVGSFADMEELLAGLEPRYRIEKEEKVWRLWDMAVVLALLAVVLTAEWVWRKFVGLV